MHYKLASSISLSGSLAEESHLVDCENNPRRLLIFLAPDDFDLHYQPLYLALANTEQLLHASRETQ